MAKFCNLTLCRLLRANVVALMLFKYLGERSRKNASAKPAKKASKKNKKASKKNKKDEDAIHYENPLD